MVGVGGGKATSSHDLEGMQTCTTQTDLPSYALRQISLQDENLGQ